MKEYDPKRHCGATTRQRGAPCVQPKGYGTVHVGRGRCKFHGGISPKKDRRIKTGLFSPYLQGVLKAPHDHIRKVNADLMDLTPHLELMNVLLGHVIQERDGSETRLVEWYNKYGETVNIIIRSNDPAAVAAAVTKLKESGKIPAGRLDVDGVTRLVKDIGGLVEKMHRMKQTTSVTLEAVTIYAEKLLLVVFRHVKDKKVLAALKAEWSSVGIDLDQGDQAGH